MSTAETLMQVAMLVLFVVAAYDGGVRYPRRLVRLKNELLKAKKRSIAKPSTQTDYDAGYIEGLYAANKIMDDR